MKAKSCIGGGGGEGGNMSELKNVSVENSLTAVEDCLVSLPGTGGTITAEIKSKIEKAQKSVAHLRKVLSEVVVDDASCGRRPSVRPEG
jgi:BioD-like phosphotransacetylase family protein